MLKRLKKINAKLKRNQSTQQLAFSQSIYRYTKTCIVDDDTSTIKM